MSAEANSALARPVSVMMLGSRGCPGVQGGVERHVEQLSLVLAASGHHVEVVARAAYMPGRAPFSWQGVSVTPLWAPRHGALEAIVHTALGILHAAWRRPDIVHIHAIGPALLAPLARLAGLHVVVTHHSFNYHHAKWSRAARAVLRLGERAGMRFAHGRICVSRDIAETMRGRYRVPAAHIPNGVTVMPVPAGHAVLDRFGLAPGRYLVTVGRLTPEKRHLDLIRAFSRAAPRGWKLAIIGAADHPDAYSRSVEQAAQDTSNVVLTGFQGGADLAELFGNAGAFALTSSHEGLPIALLEALAYGLPSLASDIPANREIPLAPDRYFPVGDIDALAALIAQVCTAEVSDEEREAYRQIARTYDWGEAARRTLDLYETVLAQPLYSDLLRFRARSTVHL